MPAARCRRSGWRRAGHAVDHLIDAARVIGDGAIEAASRGCHQRQAAAEAMAENAGFALACRQPMKGLDRAGDVGDRGGQVEARIDVTGRGGLRLLPGPRSMRGRSRHDKSGATTT